MTDSVNQSQVQLLIRRRELSAMKEVLLYVQSLQPVKKDEWVATNGEELSMAFQQFVSVSEQTMKNMELDPESLQMSYELIQELRATEQLVQEVFGESKAMVS